MCPFHGFEFDAEGHRQHIPANGKEGKVPKGMALKPFPVREQHGLVWLWLGIEREIYPAVPFFPELSEGWQHTSMIADWPVHYTRAIENQLDVAHLPFVHRTTIGAGERTLVEGPYVEADETAVNVRVTNKRDDGRPPRSMMELAAEAQGKAPSLSFLFPALWRLNISPKLKRECPVRC